MVRTIKELGHPWYRILWITGIVSFQLAPKLAEIGSFYSFCFLLDQLEVIKISSHAPEKDHFCVVLNAGSDIIHGEINFSVEIFAVFSIRGKNSGNWKHI